MNVPSTFIPSGWPDDYSRWLVGIHRYLQEKGQTDLPVYMNAEDEDLDRIAVLGSVHLSGGSSENFVKTVMETIKFDEENPQQAFALYNSMRFWKASKYPKEIPPFLPILILSVMAAEQMRSDELFVSSNYYGRLSTLAGYNPIHKDKIGNSYRKYIASFWNEFNEWLVKNPEIGLPTAYISVSQGFNDYVGVPIGQALLRSGEQEAIESEFFEKFFNAGGSKDFVEVEEFFENLDAWMASAGATHRMKVIYRQAQDVLRSNIWELFERWQPRTRGVGVGTGGRKTGLKLILRMSSGLKGRYARFSLNANFAVVSFDNHFVDLTFSDNETISLTALADQYVGLGTMIPMGDRLSDVLAGSTNLLIRDKQEVVFTANRQPRAVIPFEIAVPGTWVEVSQMRLGEKYSLVAAAASLEHTMALLQKFGTGATVTSVFGLPDQWKLITGFIPTSSIGAPDNLPIQRVKGIHLSLVNGLRLPGNSGIAEYPLTEPPSIQVLQAVDGKHPVLRIEGPADWYKEYTELDSLVSPSFSVVGEYVIRLFETSKAHKSIAYRRFILRDGNFARHIPATGDGSLGVRFYSSHHVEVDFVSATDQFQSLVQGARLVEGEIVPFSRNQGTKELSGQTIDGDLEAWQEEVFATQKSVELAACILNPYAKHLRKVIDQVPGRRQRFQRWVCAYCGTFGYIDTKSKKENQIIKPKVLEKTELPHLDPNLLHERDVAILGAPRDLIEKRIWVLGGGGLREATSFSDLNELNFVTQVLWSLAVSGHIDIVGMETDICTGEWRTNPLTAVSVPGGFRLVGHRAGAVIDALNGELTKIGGMLSTSTHVDPTFVSDVQIVGVDLENLETIVSNLEEGLNHMMRVDVSVAQSFLWALPSMSLLREKFQPHPYMDTSQSTEYFDLPLSKWQSAESVNLVGRLVRDAKYGTTYRFVVGGDPVCYQAVKCGYRLGKHLTAHWNGRILISYDPGKQELAVPLGAELPLLYSRGVVFLTGSMPYRRKNQTIYSGISEKVFQQVRTLLSE